jgi:hypothetical protein
MKNSTILKLSITAIVIITGTNLLAQAPTAVDFNSVNSNMTTATTGVMDFIKWIFYLATAVGLLFTTLAFVQNKQDAKTWAIGTGVALLISVLFSLMF